MHRHAHGAGAHSHAPPPGAPRAAASLGEERHVHANTDAARRLRIALAITASVLVAEVVGGIIANSLALLADAGHVLTDAAALALSLVVTSLLRRPETPSKTYGYLRWEILAAFLNGAVLLVLSVWIVWEAITRLRHPAAVQETLMLAVAVLGLAANLAAARILHPASSGSMNVRGAYLHVLGDLLGSVGTVVAAMVIHVTGWTPADPLASLLVTALVVHAAWRLVRESVDVLLESTPAHIALDSVRSQLHTIPGVASVHDLHVWTVTSGHYAMSVHVVVPDAERHQHVLEHIHDAMRLYGIDHVTVQLEQAAMYERELHLHE
ncbi:MAG TPA: cation diffusion facilitator family transporter [Gemmatimonadaceae bacterium]|nr:cation diffusion facilitator family transporter [Gemmatimonadaceae bacterium]